VSDNRPALGDTRPSVSDLTAWVAGRATVRQFDSEADIPDDEIREIIDAGRKAPTSGTTQIYSFVWIHDQSRREHIHELCERGTIQVEEASHFLLVCIDVRRIQQLLEHRSRAFMVSPLMGLLEGAIDASLAAGTAMLVAESKGYSVCPIGNILNNLDGVARVTDLPAGVLPLYGLCIGVPAEGSPRENCPRVPLDGVLHEEGYEDPSPALLDACHTAMDAMYSNSVYGDEQTQWVDTLQRYWGPEGFMNNRESMIRRTLVQQGFLTYRDFDGQAMDGESDTETLTQQKTEHNDV
jgi:FMN reductase (NADPH)